MVISKESTKNHRRPLTYPVLWVSFRFIPEPVLNMDETMLAVNAKKVKVYVPRSVKSAKRLDKVKLSMHITLICWIAADGTALKQTAILPLKHFPADLEPLQDNWSGSSTGWIDEAIYSRLERPKRLQSSWRMRTSSLPPSPPTRLTFCSRWIGECSVRSRIPSLPCERRSPPAAQRRKSGCHF